MSNTLNEEDIKSGLSTLFGAIKAQGEAKALVSPEYAALKEKSEVIESIYHYEPDSDEDDESEYDEELVEAATQAKSEPTVSTTIEALKHSNSQKKEEEE